MPSRVEAETLDSGTRKRSASVLSSASSCTLVGDADTNMSDLAKVLPRQAQNNKKARTIDNDGEDQDGDEGEELRERLGTVSVIDLDDDEDQEDEFVQHLRTPPVVNIEDDIIDLDAIDDDELERIVYRPVARVQRSNIVQEVQIRNPPIRESLIELKSCNWNALLLTANMTVEMQNKDFIRIKNIIRNALTGEITLRGWLLRRCKMMEGVLECQLNELSFIYDVDKNDPRPIEEQSVIDVSLSSCLRRRTLIRTNETRPQNAWSSSFGQIASETKEQGTERIRDYEKLYVRWKHITVWENAKARMRSDREPNQFIEKSVVRLTEGECTKGKGITKGVLRYEWRGETKLGGSGYENPKPNFHSRPGSRPRGRTEQNNQDVDFFHCEECGKQFFAPERFLDHHEREHFGNVSGSEGVNVNSRQPTYTVRAQVPRGRLQRYTYGDTFSGAGGSMSGATNAGLDVIFGMDFSPNVQQTLLSNFPNSKIYHQSCSDFVITYRGPYVDILHLSPPCQPWSPAYTTVGPNDAMNVASLFSITELVKRTKPRLVTLEQTFGLLRESKRMAFNVGLVNALTRIGYSVAWKIVDFSQWGLPQKRKRLVLIAAGPGETLPPFPPATHSANPSPSLNPGTRLLPLVRPIDILRSIPRNTPNHNLANTSRSRNYKPWDGTKPTKTITTGGGENACHPSGQRGMTHREFAALCGFTNNHVFYGKGIKTQIGNAVPSGCWMYLLRSLVRELERNDRVEGWREVVRVEDNDDDEGVVVLD